MICLLEVLDWRLEPNQAQFNLYYNKMLWTTPTTSATQAHKLDY